MAIKVDIHKAYDKVDQGFLEAVTRKMTNNQHGQGKIFEHIDKVVANFDWFHMFSYYQLYHDKFFGSDHKLLILYLTPKTRKPPKSFAFNMSWTTSDDCATLINTLQCFSSSQADIQNKLNFCREVLPYWSSYVFGNSKRKIQELSAKLDSLLSNDYVNLVEIVNARNQLQEQQKLEELYWFQNHRSIG